MTNFLMLGKPKGSGCGCKKPAGSGASYYPRWVDPRDSREVMDGLQGLPAFETPFARLRAVAASIMQHIDSWPRQPSNQRDWWEGLADYYTAANAFNHEVEKFRGLGGRLSERGAGLMRQAFEQMATAKRMADAMMQGHNSWQAQQLAAVRQAAAPRFPAWVLIAVPALNVPGVKEWAIATAGEADALARKGAAQVERVLEALDGSTLPFAAGAAIGAAAVAALALLALWLSR